MPDGRVVIVGDFLFVNGRFSPSIAILDAETGGVDTHLTLVMVSKVKFMMLMFTTMGR